MDKRLLLFSILYTAVTIYFIHDIERDQSASLAYLFIFPLFWILGGVALGLLIWLGKIKIKGWNIIALIFSTPLPVFLWAYLPIHQPCSTLVHNKDGHRIKEIT